MSKFSKKKKGLPPINTASLPDIVFMLLFFFMVATTMRETTVMVAQQIPNATEIKKLQDKRLISYIYVGEAQDKDAYGEGDKIQLNDKISDVKEVRSFIFAAREGINEDERDYMTTMIKADENCSVGTINDIKKELREINALKVTYSARPGELK
ncbi:MAG: biopolymer transporter ExbD [Bacteroidetes bacterium MedPE-SWsnd-G1]|uniref:Biopolymer transporter ExbD n=1 Tax=Urechidicola vernalis TaxID=3075600 RepID=A0ABU2Y814_9FLAO|nr:biopolymer transporter ExbD [Urechidicola sp. P050]MDT0553183.1 biopolymer transporter ExbD [Urechidicola sp. P050]OIQ39619.1 MAG: biopolymer transporter ExbD [Bacteroidetes bacterium MedPE-SWsnd-G1]